MLNLEKMKIVKIINAIQFTAHSHNLSVRRSFLYKPLHHVLVHPEAEPPLIGGQVHGPLPLVVLYAGGVPVKHLEKTKYFRNLNKYGRFLPKNCILSSQFLKHHQRQLSITGRKFILTNQSSTRALI